MGLFHSKKIIEAHQGRIEVESEEGKGSTFRVLLPIIQGGGGRVQGAGRRVQGINTGSRFEDRGRQKQEKKYKNEGLVTQKQKQGTRHDDGGARNDEQK